MANGIAGSRADTQAHTASCTRIRLNDWTGDATILDQAKRAGYRTVIDAEPAFLTIPWKAGFPIDRSRCHPHRQIMPQHARFARINAREIVAHDTGRSQGINHGCTCTGFSGCFRCPVDCMRRAGLDAVTAPGTGGQELSFCNSSGWSLQEAKRGRDGA